MFEVHNLYRTWRIISQWIFRTNLNIENIGGGGKKCQSYQFYPRYYLISTLWQTISRILVEETVGRLEDKIRGQRGKSSSQMQNAITTSSSSWKEGGKKKKEKKKEVSKTSCNKRKFTMIKNWRVVWRRHYFD